MSLAPYITRHHAAQEAGHFSPWITASPTAIEEPPKSAIGNRQSSIVNHGRYRVITFSNGTAALQSRRPGFFPRWLTLALGTPAELTTTAARMNAERLQSAI